MEQEEVPPAECSSQMCSVPQAQTEDLDGRGSCSETTELLLESPLEKQTEEKKRKRGAFSLDASHIYLSGQR